MFLWFQPELNSSIHKSSSCTSLDSGKESACDDQLLRPDHLSDQVPEKLTLCLKGSSPHSPDSGASGSSESPPTEAAAVSLAATLSHNPPLRQHSEPTQHDLLPGGLKRTHHSIDEALSSAQCVATAVLSGKDGMVAQGDSLTEDEGTSDDNVRTDCTVNLVDVSSSVPHYGTNSSFPQELVCDVRQKQTPDLVLDLPLRLSPGCNSTKDCDTGVPSVDKDEGSHSSSPTGPESPDMTTAAERFAKQNQCTLKKNTKASQSLGSPLDGKAINAHHSPRHSKSVDCQSEKDTMKSVDGAPISNKPEATPSPNVGNEKKPCVSSFKPPIKAKPHILNKK